MDYKKMEYFIMLVEEKNFTKAAKKLYISQSSLSDQLKKIGEELDCQLIARNKPPIILTKEGEMFYEYCLQSLNDYKKMRRKIKNFNKNVNLGLFPSKKVNQWLQLIDGYNQQHYRKIRYYYNYADKVKKKLLKGELDIGILFRNDELDHRGYFYKKISNVSLSIYGKKQYHSLEDLMIVSLDHDNSKYYEPILKKIMYDNHMKEEQMVYLETLEETLFNLNNENTAAILFDDLATEQQLFKLSDKEYSFGFGWYYKENSEEIEWIINNLK